MAQKKYKQFFAKDFTGIDGESTPLEPDAGGVNRAINLEYAVGNSLRGRVGCQSTGYGFTSIFPYTYTRTQAQYDIVYDSGNTLSTSKTAADGASITKLIGTHLQAFTLDTMNITLTYVSGTYPFTHYTYVNGSNINFVIKANGVSILDTSLGTGLGAGAFTNIYSLLNTIDALAQLSVATTRGVRPPFAIVNGNQTTAGAGSATYGTRYTVTVDAGHTFYPGDIITFNLTTGFFYGIVISRGATTITYVGPQVTVSDNDIIGYQGQPATSINISTAVTTSSGNITLSIPYWRAIPDGDSNGGAASYIGAFTSGYNLWSTRSANSFYAPATATNASGCLYIASSGKSSDGTSSYSNNLLKIDNNQVFRAGLPQAEAPSVALAAGVGALSGVYKYKTYLKRYDAQGNVVEGRPSDIYTITYTAGAGTSSGTVTVTGTMPLYSEYTGFQTRSCFKYTAEAPAAGVAFMVDDNSAAPGLNAFIQPGDLICLSDNVVPLTGLTGVGTLHRTICTFYDGTTTPSSIKVEDSSGYTIADNSTISTGLTLVVLRTAAGANTFYELCEFPVTGYSGTISFTDNVTDTVLTGEAQYEEAELGKEHDPPPACSLVCQHQGGLVVARGVGSPNTVSYSSIDGIEYFPLASNSFDVPSTQSGFITAIASDTNDRLAVFKERAYYDIQGDLDGGAFSVNVRLEGDFGITSQASLVRVQEVLVGLSRNGFVIVADGNLAWKPYKELNTRLIAQNYQYAWAVATNDPLNRSYACTIPIIGSEPVTYVIDYSREVNHTFERTFTTKIDPAGGYAPVGDSFYYLSHTSPYSVFRRLRRFDGDSPSGNGDGDSFIDNTNAITYILETNPISNNEPDILNTPIRLRLWSLPNDYVEEGWVTFSTLVEGGCSPLAANCGTGNNSTSSSVTFSTTADIFKDVKLVSAKTHFYIVRLTTNTIRTSPFWTGFEILYAESYDAEDLIK